MRSYIRSNLRNPQFTFSEQAVCKRAQFFLLLRLSSKVVCEVGPDLSCRSKFLTQTLTGLHTSQSGEEENPSPHLQRSHHFVLAAIFCLFDGLPLLTPTSDLPSELQKLFHHRPVQLLPVHVASLAGSESIKFPICEIVSFHVHFPWSPMELEN